MLVAASVVDRQLEGYLRSQGTDQTWGVQERILVCVTAESDATEMLESGRRNADRFQGEFYVLHFRDKPLSKEQQDRLEKNLKQARELGATVHTLTDSDVVGDPRVCDATRNHADLRRSQFYAARLLDTAAGQPGGPSHPSRGGNRCHRLPPQVSPEIGENLRGRRGRLHLYLGYAAGVGKTYRMLEDAQQFARQGKDIVIGYFEPHGRKDTMAKTAGLEMVPTRSSTVGGAVFQEMDTDAILARHPAICVVDELAHTNVPGSTRAKDGRTFKFYWTPGSTS